MCSIKGERSLLELLKIYACGKIARKKLLVLNICVAKDKGVGEDKVEKKVVGWGDL